MGHLSGTSARSGAALALYWMRVLPLARRELRRWEAEARAIPDPALRTLALTKLDEEGICAEGVAAFGILAERALRLAVVRFCVAFEVLYDFVDGVGERPVADPLAANRRLGRALVAAVDDRFAPRPFAEHLPSGDDGGYGDALIATCRSVLAKLPSYDVARTALRRTVERAAEAQSLNHGGAAQGDLAALERWAAARARAHGLRWWEAAAAAAAPLGVYALCALASRRHVTGAEVAAVETAYFPWVAGLLGVLESLVDRDQDAAAGTLSYVARYATDGEAARRAASIAAQACARVLRIPDAPGHRVIVAGMVATNLSHRGARDPTARRVGARVRDEVAGPVSLLLVLLRGRRWLRRSCPGSARLTMSAARPLWPTRRRRVRAPCRRPTSVRDRPRRRRPPLPLS